MTLRAYALVSLLPLFGFDVSLFGDVALGLAAALLQAAVFRVRTR